MDLRAELSSIKKQERRINNHVGRAHDRGWAKAKANRWSKNQNENPRRREIYTIHIALQINYDIRRSYMHTYTAAEMHQSPETRIRHQQPSLSCWLVPWSIGVWHGPRAYLAQITIRHCSHITGCDHRSSTGKSTSSHSLQSPHAPPTLCSPFA
jgi:hypothetical protein